MLGLVRFGGLLGLVGLVGCSSENEGGGGGSYAPLGNGVAVSEDEACQAVRSAEIDRRNGLGCGLITLPICPAYLTKGDEPCMQYDQGTVQACAAYITELESCEAVTSWQCVVQPIPDSAGKGCS
jgi:hypothetical protein